MENLKKILEKIREQPKLYLGKPSLKLLHAFISGYILALYDIYGDSLPEFYPGFQEYIQRKYDIKISKGYMEIIEFFSASEESAFNTYFELLDKYIEENNLK